MPLEMVKIVEILDSRLRDEVFEVLHVSIVERVVKVLGIASLPEVRIMMPIDDFIHSDIGNDHLELLEP